jgi:alpha-L-fucosidase
VSRGGNFLLNVGPDGKGDWDPVVYQRLEEIGGWMKINGEAIYASGPVAPYSSGNIYYTQSKDKKAVYAFWLSDKDVVTLPARIDIPVQDIHKPRSVVLLGKKTKLKWHYINGHIILEVPESLQRDHSFKYSGVFKIMH